MGKYMRKSKTTTVEISLMDVSHQSLGVRTRAKTLALQKLQKSPAAASGDSYLQLRSRRLAKPPTGDSKRQKQPAKQRCVPNPNPNPNPRLRDGPVNSGSVNLGKKVREDVKKEGVQKLEINNGVDLGTEFEASFGENVLEFEGRERSTRESTPCSLIRDPDSTIRTPGSSTRRTRRSGQNQNSIPRHIPTAHEMNEFFTGAEERQQRQFIDKYNFDPAKDKPLPGRYEWVKLNP